MKKGKKKKWILLLIGVGMVLLVIVGAVVLSQKNKTYRLLKVESYAGIVTLQRDAAEQKVFEGMHLKSGDVVNTGEESNTLLLADDDKHLLVEENTGFSIVAAGNKEKGGITINLEYGSALITIDNKLNAESSFEVHTPNATLSIRGTIFRVTYDKAGMYTIVEILEGTVEITSETSVIMGGAGETYYVDAQGMIQEGTPYEEPETSGEIGGDGEAEIELEVGEDLAELPDNGLVEPVTITQAQFESNYMEEIIELTPENSKEYFEIVEKDGSYYLVLKPGYTHYGNDFSVDTNIGDYHTPTPGSSRYIFSMEGTGNPQDWIKSLTASGTIVKYTIPDNMWYKVNDVYIILIERPDDSVFVIER